jgi:hypothetical protein
MGYWQVFWLALAESFPWHRATVVVCFSNRAWAFEKVQTTCTRCAYSYGDSAGLAPDFPF